MGRGPMIFLLTETPDGVRIRGSELWQFDRDGLIGSSKGRFDTAEYYRQLQYGVAG
jgi:hypothetical protein